MQYGKNGYFIPVAILLAINCLPACAGENADSSSGRSSPSQTEQPSATQSGNNQPAFNRQELIRRRIRQRFQDEQSGAPPNMRSNDNSNIRQAGGNAPLLSPEQRQEMRDRFNQRREESPGDAAGTSPVRPIVRGADGERRAGGVDGVTGADRVPAVNGGPAIDGMRRRRILPGTNGSQGQFVRGAEPRFNTGVVRAVPDSTGGNSRGGIGSGGASANSGQPPFSSGLTRAVGNIDINAVNGSSVESLRESVQRLKASGASPEQIKMLLKQKQMEMIDENSRKMSELNRLMNEMQKDIIKNIRS